MYAHDRNSKLNFLVDTGASISVVPASKFGRKKRNPDDGVLAAANGSKIATYGERILSLDIGLRREYPFVFIAADVQHPIIGADFLSKFKINVDMYNRTLTDAITSVSVKTGRIFSDQTKIYITEEGPHLQILQKFPSLTSKEDRVPIIRHNFEHKIVTNGAIPCVRPRKLNPSMLKVVKTKINQMLEEGVIRPSDSPYASPLHMVPKSDNTYRLVGDYRFLNSATLRDSYPLPYLQDFSLQLHNKKVFSKIDLKDAFFQLPIAEEDIPKTTITTPIGAFEYTRLNFGLCGAAQSFQRFIDCVLRNLKSNNSQQDVTLFAYIDDIIIASDNEEMHKQDLEALFKRLSEYNLKINLMKCQFIKKSIDFLGHRVTENGITPLPDKVSAVVDFPVPKTYRQLRKFIGLVNYYHRFIKNAAQILAPLNDYLAGYKKSFRNKLVVWTERTLEAFNEAKNSLANSTLLSFPVPNAELGLFTDASSIAVGAVLQQKVHDIWYPLAFFSKKLNKSQQLSSTFARELLAIYLSCKHFNHWLEGNSITIFTDHKPLLGAFNKPLDRPNQQESRQLSFIAQYSPTIKHIQGTDNIVADTLSRPQIDCIASMSVLSHSIRNDLIDAQKSDDSLKNILRNNDTSLVIQLVDGIYCDTSMNIARPFVPVSLKKRIFDQIHNLAHPGIKQSIDLISKRFVWISMKKDIKDFANACEHCQMAKITRYNKTVIENIPNDVPKFSSVHMDIVGPIPQNKGYSYLLTIIDRYTRWPEAIPIKDTRAETVANAFIAHWISRYGVPDVVVTDRGSNFESCLFNNLLKRIGCQHKRTTAYHPKSNGLIERFHSTLKSALRNGQEHTWLDRLPFVLLGLRVSFKAELSCSPSDMLYGYSIKLPVDLLVETEKNDIEPDEYADALRTAMRNVRPPVTRTPPTTGYLDPKLQTCTHVFIKIQNKRGLEPNFRGPFKVLEKHEKYFLVDLNGKPDTVSIERIKAAYIVNFEPNVDGHLDGNQDWTFAEDQVPMVPNQSENDQPLPNVESPSPRAEKKMVTFQEPLFSRSGRRLKSPSRFSSS